MSKNGGFYLNSNEGNIKIARELLKLAKQMIADGDDAEDVNQQADEDNGNPNQLMKEFEQGVNEFVDDMKEEGENLEEVQENIEEGNTASATASHSFTASRKRFAREAMVASLKQNYAEVLASVDSIIANVRQYRIACKKARTAAGFGHKYDEDKEVGSISNAIGSAIHNFAKLVGKIIGKAAWFGIGAVLLVFAGIAKAIEWLGSALAKIPGLASDACNAFCDKMREFFEKARKKYEDYKNRLEQLKEEVKKAAGDAKARIKQEISDLKDEIEQSIKDFADTVVSWILKQGKEFIAGLTSGERWSPSN